MPDNPESGLQQAALFMFVNIDELPSFSDVIRRRRLAAFEPARTASQNSDRLELQNITIPATDAGGYTNLLTYDTFDLTPPAYVDLTSYNEIDQLTTAKFTITGSGTASGCVAGNGGSCPSDTAVYNFQLDLIGPEVTYPSAEDYQIGLAFSQGSAATTDQRTYHISDFAPFSIVVAGSQPGGRRLLQVELAPFCSCVGCCRPPGSSVH